MSILNDPPKKVIVKIAVSLGVILLLWFIEPIASITAGLILPYWMGLYGD